MNHSMWIVSFCLGLIIGRAISERNLQYGIPATIGLIMVLLIAGGVLNP